MTRGLPKRMVDLTALPTAAPVPTAEQRAMFLEAVLRGASVHVAASAAGLPYRSFFHLRLSDEAFAAELEMAKEERATILEEIAIKFAVEGVAHETVKRVSKPVEIEGEPLTDVAGDQVTSVEETVTTGREFGPHSLLQFLLRGQLREKYGTDRREDHLTVNPGAPPAVRTNADAQRLLERMRVELRPVIDGQAVEVKHDDGADLV